MYASTIFAPYIKSLKMDNLVIASPDVGGSKRAGSYSKHLGVPMVICYKTREKANVIADMKIIGDVEGKNVVITDDMVDTAGTLCKAADLMIKKGATSVQAIVSHGVMSGSACERIENSALTEIAFTDSIPFDTARCKKAKVLSVAEMFADTIQRVQEHKSISEQYIM
jgi:ribose-phosphate pyrophosphokinase